jgi:hypothetical protein
MLAEVAPSDWLLLRWLLPSGRELSVEQILDLSTAITLGTFPSAGFVSDTFEVADGAPSYWPFMWCDTLAVADVAPYYWQLLMWHLPIGRELSVEQILDPSTDIKLGTEHVITKIFIPAFGESDVFWSQRVRDVVVFLRKMKPRKTS